MKINADFTKRALVRPGDVDWIPSPMAGVERKMLDRIGEEVARATSIVRYAPKSYFEEHTHGGGEEFFVLEGIFSDQHGDYPAGTYVRNPIGTQHTPRIGEAGATIFVKLDQFDPNDQASVCIDTHKAQWHQGIEEGLMVLPLHEFENEAVAMMQWSPGITCQPHLHEGGAEMLVIAGALYDENGFYPAGSWIRLPANTEHSPFTEAEGAMIYIKTGHLS